MRFLHTSDWHLGRIFHGVHLTDDQAHALEQFVRLVGDTKPDAVVIAGDIYDRAVPPTEAVELLDNTLSAMLLDYKVPVILIAGNHDSPERLGFGNRLLARQGLYVAGSLSGSISPIVLEDAGGPVYFVPLPYAEPAMVRERLGVAAGDHEQAMQAMVQAALTHVPEQARKVAIAHAFIAGSQESESERPLSVGGSAMVPAGIFTPFHYTALGHLHNSQQAGHRCIRYPGSLLKYSFAEAGQQKGIQLVDIDNHGQVTIETYTLSPRRDVRCLSGYFKDLLKGPQPGENREDYIMVSLQDVGPILDARGQLEGLYPNILHLELAQYSGNPARVPAADHRRMSEQELFAAFFDQMTGQPLDQEQTAHFAGVLEEMYREEREVKL